MDYVMIYEDLVKKNSFVFQTGQNLRLVTRQDDNCSFFCGVKSTQK